MNLFGVFHELAHGLTALAFGFSWYGIYIGFPQSYAEVSGVNSYVLFAGGGVQSTISFLCFWVAIKNPKISRGLDGRAYFFLLFLTILSFVYGFWEVMIGI